jgi:hypothetical protein
MSQIPPNHRRYCPYLGLQVDRASVFIEPAEEHRCYVAARSQRIDLDHQVAFCLTTAFEACPRFVVPPDPAPSSTLERPSSVSAAGLDSLPVPGGATLRPPSRLRRWLTSSLEGISILQAVAWIVIVLLVLVVIYGYLNLRQSLTEVAPPAGPTLALATSTPSPTEPAPTETPTSLPEAVPPPASAPTPLLPTATLPPGGLQITLYPASNAVGWVSSDDPLNHFGDRNLHVGVFKGQTYYGAMQFSLTSIPLGSKIQQATLELSGLSAENLATGGAWALRLLSSEVDQNWRTVTYDQIHDALVLDTIPPELKPQDLAAGQVNIFTFTPAQLTQLERRLETGLVSFRLDGPTQGPDNLFTWDTGYGGGFGSRPVLRLVYQLPPTPTPIVMAALPTATLTPANAVTAAALAVTATYEATAFGTPTPWPTNFVTATPPVVVTNTPMPGNTATAQWMAALATAETFLNGTPTPLPTDVWTATPSPTSAIVTSTPTPDNALTVVALAATATRVAASTGTYTPVPENWVTPIIVTPQPTPANTATAAYQDALATAEAIAFGTPTPTPMNVWTVTPTPIFVLLNGEIPTPGPTPTPTATPQPIPAELVGKIAFLSDRAYHTDARTERAEGEKALPLGEPLVYVIDPDGGNLALLSDRWPYDLASERDVYSTDQRFRVFVKDATIDTDKEDTLGNITPIQLRVPSLFFFDYYYKVEEQITQFGADEGHLPIAYEPSWSPTAEQIAFVSNDSGNDEIWIVNRDGSGSRQLTRDEYGWWDKHPSWSPDGSKIVFWSNRTGNRQIWVMDADGGNLYSLSHTGFNDWDPVWIKYTDPPRAPK